MKKEKEIEPVEAQNLEAQEAPAQVKVVEEQETQMPAPVTMDYTNMYELTDLFLEHLKVSLRDVVCEKAVPYYNYAEEHRNSISQADLNGFIKRIDSSFTFGQVGDLMRNIGTKEGQEAYFKLLPKPQNND